MTHKSIQPDHAQNPAGISMIYMTQGDVCYNGYNLRSNKVIGLVINDKIHWFNEEFACLYDAQHIMAKSGLVITSAGEWGVKDDNNEVVLKRKITRINKPHDEIFNKESSYYKRSQRADDGDLYWNNEELTDKYPKIVTVGEQRRNKPIRRKKQDTTQTPS